MRGNTQRGAEIFWREGGPCSSGPCSSGPQLGTTWSVDSESQIAFNFNVLFIYLGCSRLLQTVYCMQQEPKMNVFLDFNSDFLCLLIFLNKIENTVSITQIGFKRSIARKKAILSKWEILAVFN